MKLLQRLKNLFLPEGEISDGFHSFDELYHYRMLYNAAFFNSLEGKYEVHKSYRHSDVEANTIEEAVEKVRYEEVDCYDSEQIYEVIDELDPVDNNGSPTREIYNDKDELMWHNAELVNRGEIITQGIRSISENLSLIMEGEPESFRGGDIAFSTARRVMEMLGWKCSYAGKATLGQDAYYCIICTKPDKDFKYKIFGNAYEGSISISKEKL